MSATVPMEFQFGTGGNLKSAKRLRNLDLKKNRPTVHPLFGNTGSVVGQAYAATNFKPAALPKPNSISRMPPQAGRSALPLKSGTKLINQGIASSMQPELPAAVVNEPAAAPPPTISQPGPITESKGGFFSSGKNVVLAGGGLIGFVVIVYMLFFNKKGTKHKRRKTSNNGKKYSKGRRNKR